MGRSVAHSSLRMHLARAKIQFEFGETLVVDLLSVFGRHLNPKNSTYYVWFIVLWLLLLLRCFLTCLEVRSDHFSEHNPINPA
jgi:hypothetical protein